MRIRNKFSGQVLEVKVTPINGAHIVRRGTVELHRGNETTARRYLANMVDSMPAIWEYAF